MSGIIPQATIEISVVVEFATGSDTPTGMRFSGRSLANQRGGVALVNPDVEQLSESSIYFWLAESLKNIGLTALRKEQEAKL